jgi:hypothetical protein
VVRGRCLRCVGIRRRRDAPGRHSALAEGTGHATCVRTPGAFCRHGKGNLCWTDEWLTNECAVDPPFACHSFACPCPLESRSNHNLSSIGAGGWRSGFGLPAEPFAKHRTGAIGGETSAGTTGIEGGARPEHRLDRHLGMPLEGRGQTRTLARSALGNAARASTCPRSHSPGNEPG